MPQLSPATRRRLNDALKLYNDDDDDDDDCKDDLEWLFGLRLLIYLFIYLFH